MFIKLPFLCIINYVYYCKNLKTGKRVNQMKALLLSVSAGSGHKKTAETIKNYILSNSPSSEIKIIDTLRYINPILDRVVIGSYLKTIKINPSLYGKLYDYAEYDEGLNSFVVKLSEMMAKKLLPLIRNFNPDIILCTHPFPTEMVSNLKGKNKINVPTINVLTDYGVHSLWVQPNIDAYIVSNKDMETDLMERNIPKEIIYPIGIPIEPSFSSQYDREDTLNSLGLDSSKFTFLVMGGSLGIGKIAKIYKQLSQLDREVQIVVITGNNKKLYSNLKKLQENSNKPTRIIGYTEDVNKYMQVCDLLITKPGGITITEAFACGIPLAIFSPIPGQEEQNADFLFKHNLSVNLGFGENCKGIIEDLLSSNTQLKYMKENCSKYVNHNSGNELYNLMVSLINKER
jgi:processive 1,2-diacylglycerol beta-glucosyltransferase